MSVAGSAGEPSSWLIDLTGGERRWAGRPGPPAVHVLLAQADSLFADLVVGVLDEAGITVEVVDRLSTALARIVRDGIDVIISDLDLGDSSGPEIIGFLRRAAPDLPIIVLSGVDDIEVAVSAIQEGAEEYVVRSRFSALSLIWLVRLVIERHRRVAAEPGRGWVDRPSGFANRAALQVIGRHLLRVIERSGLHLGVVLVTVQPATRGQWADQERLLNTVCQAMKQTLRRCDLVSRIDQGELAALVVSEGPLGGAVTRLEQAMVEGGAGFHVRLGFVAYDPQHPLAFDELLEEARSNAHPILA